MYFLSSGAKGLRLYHNLVDLEKGTPQAVQCASCCPVSHKMDHSLVFDSVQACLLSQSHFGLTLVLLAYTNVLL